LYSDWRVGAFSVKILLIIEYEFLKDEGSKT